MNDSKYFNVFLIDYKSRSEPMSTFTYRPISNILPHNFLRKTHGLLLLITCLDTEINDIVAVSIHLQLQQLLSCYMCFLRPYLVQNHMVIDNTVKPKQYQVNFR